MIDYEALLSELYTEFHPNDDGKIATYIPELAKADPNHFGISIVLTDGTVYHTGDAEHLFSIQSVSKPFTYGMALADNGREAVLKRVAVEPDGKKFNSIVLDENTGRPSNPMMNAGAIAVSDLIEGVTITDKLNRLLAVFKSYTGHNVHLDALVFTSERLTSYRNRAMTNLMFASGVVTGNIEEVLDFYTQQCSLVVNTIDLATMAATLANQGVNPRTQERALATTYVRDVLSIMHSCGMYEYSGEWAYRVGIPAKSGVSGGIMGVVPNRMGIAVFSPLLDKHGHSIRGMKVFEALSERLNLHIFSQQQTPNI
ncbi:MAG: glutaminase A [Phototrophicaceae bacterium]